MLQFRLCRSTTEHFSPPDHMPLLASWEIFRHQCTFRPQRHANLIAYISHFQSHQLAALLTLVAEEVVRRSSSLSMNQDHFHFRSPHQLGELASDIRPKMMPIRLLSISGICWCINTLGKVIYDTKLRIRKMYVRASMFLGQWPWTSVRWTTWVLTFSDMYARSLPIDTYQARLRYGSYTCTSPTDGLKPPLSSNALDPGCLIDLYRSGTAEGSKSKASNCHPCHRNCLSMVFRLGLCCRACQIG